MKIIGNSQFAAAPDEVYRALNDPAVLVRSIPGCHRLEALGDDAYTMTVAAGVGSIKGVYDGEVRLTDQSSPPRSGCTRRGPAPRARSAPTSRSPWSRSRAGARR